MKTKYYIDTEFIEYPCTIDLISIGIACVDGREYHAISSEFDGSKAIQWVKDNVIAKLDPSVPRLSREQIRGEIIAFIGDTKPEFWGYYADYDWVAFCWLFGSMIDLPKQFPKHCNDLKQEADRLAFPRDKNPPQVDDHDALADAKWNMAFHASMMTYSTTWEKTREMRR